jgi:hypothetical protein
VAAPVPSAGTLRPIIMPSAQHLISFHLVTAGGCWTIPQRSEPVRLEVGDVVVFPGGDPHVMCSDLKDAAPRGVRRVDPAAHRAVAPSHRRRDGRAGSARPDLRLSRLRRAPVQSAARGAAAHHGGERP